MSMISLGLPLAGLVVFLVGGVLYVRSLVRGRVDRRPTAIVASCTTGIALAALGVGGAALEDADLLAPAALAAPTVALASLVLFVISMRRVPLGTLKVTLGDAMIPFAALRPEGSAFHSDELAGRRVLLKFFRGQWCPFCSVELRQLDAMRDRLAAHGVEIVALSKDPPEDAAYHRERDGLRLTLLSDPALEVIRAYGVLHRKALEISRGRLSIGGIPIGLVPKRESMAAPTTLLFDEHGRVRWIDQTDDYRVRSDPARVLGAVEEVFGPAARASAIERLDDSPAPVCPMPEPVCP